MEYFEGQRAQICDLPVGVLDEIFNYLPVSDLKSASLVCRLWSEVTFSKPRLDRTRFVIDYKRNKHEDYIKLLCKSKRKYRYVKLCFLPNEFRPAVFKLLLSQFKNDVKRLDFFPDTAIYPSQFRFILDTLPNVSAVCVGPGYWQLPKKRNTQLTEFAVMHHVSEFEQKCYSLTKPMGLDICHVFPNLCTLRMDCESENSLSVFKFFSSQLIELTVNFGIHDFYILRFCKLQFPYLTKIIVNNYTKSFHNNVEIFSPFFVCHKRLRQAIVNGRLSQPIIHAVDVTDEVFDPYIVWPYESR